MDQVQPCVNVITTQHVLLSAMNVVQVVLLAYIGMRTKRKNDEERRNGNGKHL